jgi:predicted GH43/DUF377 family glycosyl hydrolase
MISIKRYSGNPILKPDSNQYWEAKATFNGCPIKVGKNVYLIYRALSFPHYHTEAGTQLSLSEIGIAKSSDGLHFKERSPFIIPNEQWERFGVEDPRVTFFENKYYIFYTALSSYPFTSDSIKVGLAISDNLKTIKEKHLVTPFNAKAMALFGERINGKIYAILTYHTDIPPATIAIASFDKKEDIWSESFWKEWEKKIGENSLNLLKNPNDQVELGSAPIKTKEGWLILISYIRGYREGKPLFTIESVLLDLNDPTKIIARSNLPLMTPQEEYEIYGIQPKIIFPSGVLEKNGKLDIYYGATDTTCCVASTKLKDVIDFTKETFEENKNKFQILLERAKENPIISPIKDHPWEAKATFNPGAVYINNRVHLIYRAMGEDNTSVFGHASSADGIHFDDRDPNPVYVPREPFEMKLVSNGNSGCEDPRLTLINNKIYMCYTAFNGKNSPQVALTSISVDNFLKKEWIWEKPVIISPTSFDDKDAAIFEEKVNKNYMIFHRIGDNIDLAFIKDINLQKNINIEEEQWLERRDGFWDGRKVGIAAPPIKTKKGWLLFYHGVSETSGTYRVGVALLDLKNPTKIIGRSDYPVLEPQMPYEKNGQVSNVVFPCGNVQIENKIFLYYGGADSVIGVATIDTDKILKIFD